MVPHVGPVQSLRVARPCSDLIAARRFYVDALGLSILAEFADHQGFDGLIVGEPGAAWHLELVHERGIAVAHPSPDDLLVLYLADAAEYSVRVQRLLAAGFAPVPSHNSYWDVDGASFNGPDGYRVVLTRRPWATGNEQPRRT
ncbi:MAG: VOC family protein [Burkholderiaceae bacterium]|jgi:catechol 2,3-dioxygenase-like lactoylglutathione lyase family enzyme|nr:VOC family protein [Burkholderiaceae bacterium]